MMPRSLAIRVCLLGLSLPGLLVANDNIAPSVSSGGPVFQCGTLSLYYMLRIEGKNVDIEQLDSQLSAKAAPRNPSLKNLRDVAGERGLRLVAYHARFKGWQPDRPLIAFMNRLPHGHFVVLRPVGPTGKLVQVLDGVREPRVLDASDLYESLEWTGVVLAPSRPKDYAAYFLGGPLGLALGWFGFLKARAVFRRSRNGSLQTSGSMGSNP